MARPFTVYDNFNGIGFVPLWLREALDEEVGRKTARLFVVDRTKAAAAAVLNAYGITTTGRELRIGAGYDIGYLEQAGLLVPGVSGVPVVLAVSDWARFGRVVRVDGLRRCTWVADLLKDGDGVRCRVRPDPVEFPR